MILERLMVLQYREDLSYKHRRLLAAMSKRAVIESEKSVEELAKSEEYDTLSDEIETLEENLGESYTKTARNRRKALSEDIR